MRQCQKPTGPLGRILLWLMNRSHSDLTDWGLAFVHVESHDVILDVGCGGGRTVAMLARLATAGKVYGIDHAAQSVAASRAFNRRAVESGTVDIRQASVSALPFADGTFDLVTAIETHFWWADLAGGMREIWRVLKPGGRLLIIAEFYDGGKHARYAARLTNMTGMASLTVDDHRQLFASAEFADVDVAEHAAKGWIRCMGTKPRRS